MQPETNDTKRQRIDPFHNKMNENKTHFLFGMSINSSESNLRFR